MKCIRCFLRCRCRILASLWTHVLKCMRLSRFKKKKVVIARVLGSRIFFQIHDLPVVGRFPSFAKVSSVATGVRVPKACLINRKPWNVHYYYIPEKTRSSPPLLRDSIMWRECEGCKGGDVRSGSGGADDEVAAVVFVSNKRIVLACHTV